MTLKIYSDTDFSGMEKAAQEVLPSYLRCKDCRLSAEIEFMSADDIKELNLRTRGIDSATDVLSYPSLENLKDASDISPSVYFADSDGEGNIFIGSIAICEQIADEQAEKYGHSIEREINYLAVHGLLHLLGYDHDREDEKQTMRKIEEEIMQKKGLER